ncbi:MAG: peptide chain release factor N(5)-glutamine methyltransferase [Solirubrobacterales bacterium]
MVEQATRRLEQAGVDSPRLDAELLLAEACESTRTNVVADLVEPTVDQFAEFELLVSRRVAREPLAQITGRKGFRNIELLVDSRVLTPRPETELLVAVAKVDRPCGILDVATGSGAVALALADELPDATIVASDISPDALAVARANADRLGAEVTFIESDLLDRIDGVFDVITANLPYVTSRELAELEPEITQYEPRLALDGGADGLDLVRRLAAQAPSQLKPGGQIALEIGAGQAGATAVILEQNGFLDVEIHDDLAGYGRVVTGRVRR